ncbi:MAG: ATP synthase subunit I [Sphingomonas sp.]|uniref:N-ATPase subunit AtpR n=1 Tax=Sphingomonas sp. TaxID=28214 RepID=UPI00356A6661
MQYFLIALWFAAGIVVGIAYFTSIWWSARQFANGGRLVATLALALLRLMLLGGLLALASFHGAGPLLAMALGVVVARFAVMRRLQEVKP